MLVGRFFLIIPTLALAGSLVRKQTVPASAGTFPTHTPLFIVLVIGVLVIVGALTFLPALALGPIVDILKLWDRAPCLPNPAPCSIPRSFGAPSPTAS